MNREQFDRESEELSMLCGESKQLQLMKELDQCVHSAQLASGLNVVTYPKDTPPPFTVYDRNQAMRNVANDQEFLNSQRELMRATQRNNTLYQHPGNVRMPQVTGILR